MIKFCRNCKYSNPRYEKPTGEFGCSLGKENKEDCDSYEEEKDTTRKYCIIAVFILVILLHLLS